jgi:hypothetical protein
MTEQADRGGRAEAKVQIRLKSTIIPASASVVIDHARGMNQNKQWRFQLSLKQSHKQ